jgi:mutator protein MutT
MPGRWEFPGGKCELGETPEAAARREAFEEIGLRVRNLRLRCEIEHVYPHDHVMLYYFDAELEDDRAEPEAERGFLWLLGSALGGLDFPEANEEVVRSLVAEGD